MAKETKQIEVAVFDDSQGLGSSNDDTTYDTPSLKEDKHADIPLAISAKATFLSLLWQNRPYRLYLLSYLANHSGEWLTYVAAITVIESINASEHSKTSQTSVAVLVVVRLIPSVLFMSIGGMLADSRDRRSNMICLDIAGAFVVLFYILAFEMESIPGIYAVTFFLETVMALYDPSRSSILPMLVPQDDCLQKATALSGLGSSLTAAAGSVIGGFASTSLGAQACILMDCATFLTSAFLMWLVGGNWKVARDEAPQEPLSLLSGFVQTYTMTVDGAKYLYSSSFGALVLVKASSGVIYGATYLLFVSFAGDDEHSGQRLGALFGLMGIGCIIGTLIADSSNDMNNLARLQLSCFLALAVQTLGIFGMAAFSPFWTVCIMTVVESAGSMILWINSSLLMQKLTAPDMLGRVCAVEFGLFTLTEALSAVLCGILQDNARLSAQAASLVFACFGSFMVLCWSCYHYKKRGTLKQDISVSAVVPASATDLEASK